MQKAKVFMSGNSQAIRIPREMQTEEKEFTIKKLGNCYFLIPDGDPWALLRYVFDNAGFDYTFERAQPMIGELPLRPALSGEDSGQSISDSPAEEI